MNSLITLRPYGGLANRMRTIASCVQLAQDVSKPMRVIWVNEKGFKCDFNNIFKPSSYFSVENNPLLAAILFPPLYQTYLRFPPYLRNAEKIGNLFYDRYFYGSSIISEDLDSSLSACKTIYITSCYNFRRMFPIARLFEPISSIQDTVQKTMNKVGKNSIGIHIRRTDNIYSIRESPLKLFIECIQEQIKKDTAVNFFLATDCRETEITLKQKFGSRIFSYNKILDRNNPKGIQDAVVDLYCLSKTRLILGSSASSFSEIAAEISSASLQIVKPTINLNNHLR